MRFSTDYIEHKTGGAKPHAGLTACRELARAVWPGQDLYASAEHDDDTDGWTASVWARDGAADATSGDTLPTLDAAVAALRVDILRHARTARADALARAAALDAVIDDEPIAWPVQMTGARDAKAGAR